MRSFPADRFACRVSAKRRAAAVRRALTHALPSGTNVIRRPISALRDIPFSQACSPQPAMLYPNKKRVTEHLAQRYHTPVQGLSSICCI